MKLKVFSIIMLFMHLGMNLFSQQMEQSILPENNIYKYKEVKIFIHDMFKDVGKYSPFLKDYEYYALKISNEVLSPNLRVSVSERYGLLINTLNDINNISIPDELTRYFSLLNMKNFDLKTYFIISAILDILNGEENYDDYINDITIPENEREMAKIEKEEIFSVLELLFNSADFQLVQNLYKELLIYPVTSIFSYF